MTEALVQAGGMIMNVPGGSTYSWTKQVLAHDPALGETPDGGLVKRGSANLHLQTNNTYTGNTLIDAGTLGALSPGERQILLGELQRMTAPGGLHALVPDGQGAGPEGFAGHYASWLRETLPPTGRRTRGMASRGALFCKPAAERSEDGRHNARA